MRKIFFLLALPAVVLISCKKTDIDSGETCPINKNTLLGRYVISSVIYKANSNAAAQDIFSGQDSCIRDNTYQLNSDSTVTTGEGATTCPGPPPPGSITAWTISADGKVFTFDAVYDVKSFDCSQLVITQNDYFTAGDTRTVTLVKR